MQVRELMIANPICCLPDTAVEDVASMMDAYHCGAILVVSNMYTRRLIGIVTDRDLVCRAIAKHKDPKVTGVNECMTTPVASIAPDATMEECCAVMAHNHIRRVPVINSMGGCEGIVSEADVAAVASPLVTGQVVRCANRYPAAHRVTHE